MKNTFGPKSNVQRKSAVASPRRGCKTGRDTPPASLDSAAAVLAARDIRSRRRARGRLVAGGKGSLALLTEALADLRQVVRWEATKALGELALAEAGPALVKALEDEDAGVRWLAAEGLIALRREAVAPLLRALVRQCDSEWLREGAHHVLHSLLREKWAKPTVPVLRALESLGAESGAPVAAEAALRKFEKA